MNKSFFEKIAIEAGTNDVEIVRKIYYGLIRKTIRIIPPPFNTI